MKEDLSRKEITRCIVNGFEVYMEYRVELGIKNMEKWEENPHSGQNSSTCTDTGQSCTGKGSVMFFYFDQLSYFSHNFLNSYQI